MADNHESTDFMDCTIDCTREQDIDIQLNRQVGVKIESFFLNKNKNYYKLKIPIF